MVKTKLLRPLENPMIRSEEDAPLRYDTICRRCKEPIMKGDKCANISQELICDDCLWDMDVYELLNRLDIDVVPYEGGMWNVF